MWAPSKSKQQVSVRLGTVFTATVALLSLFLMTPHAHAALTPITPPGPKPSSYGLEATKTQPAPTQAATITSPGSGASYSTSPITVSGLCLTGLLVQVYDNGVMMGSVLCASGSFSLQISLFTGQNDLTATVFDDLEQAGPVSNTVTVSFNNASFSAFGSLITLTSNYGRRSATPGDTLSWPLLLTGGTGPYAFSIDWGDGSGPDLKSQSLSGEVDISHVYKQAGVYKLTIKVTDVNGATAFLQLVAVANGQPVSGSTSGTSKGGTTVITRVMWIPAVICVLLLGPAYWLGRRSELVSLHKKLEQDMANYKEL